MSKTASLSSDLIVRPHERAALPSDNDNGTRARRRGPGRGLVLTDESAQHPFRAHLPPHVRADIHDIPAESLWRLTAEDARGFASVYLATTAAILAFII